MATRDKVYGIVEEVRERSTSFGNMYDLVISGVPYGNGKMVPKYADGSGEVLIGECVAFEVMRNGKYLNIAPRTTVKHDVNLLSEKAEENVPTAFRASAVSSSDRERTIVLQSCRNSAIAMATLLVNSDAALLKANQKPATRHDIIVGLVNDLTRRFFWDTMDVDKFVGEKPVSATTTSTSATSEEG